MAAYKRYDSMALAALGAMLSSFQSAEYTAFFDPHDEEKKSSKDQPAEWVLQMMQVVKSSSHGPSII